MSRSGYSDDFFDDPSCWLYRGQVASAIRGRRGQKFFRDLLAALDAMPVKRLITDELVSPDGEVCAIGSLAIARGVDVGRINESEPAEVAALFNIAECLAAEVAYENDEWSRSESPEERWERMRMWVARQIKEAQ